MQPEWSKTNRNETGGVCPLRPGSHFFSKKTKVTWQEKHRVLCNHASPTCNKHTTRKIKWCSIRGNQKTTEAQPEWSKTNRNETGVVVPKNFRGKSDWIKTKCLMRNKLNNIQSGQSSCRFSGPSGSPVSLLYSRTSSSMFFNVALPKFDMHSSEMLWQIFCNYSCAQLNAKSPCNETRSSCDY